MDGLTILEVCDVLQGILVERGMDDIPVMIQTPEGGFKSLSDISFRVEEALEGDGYDAVVIRP